MNSNFAAQLTDGSQFSRVETDKVIEMTLNKDAKTPGGCTGFSFLGKPVHPPGVFAWEINVAYKAVLRSCFHKHLGYQPQKYKYPDLNPSRIKRDQNDVQRILAIIETTFVDPFCPSQLMSISTGVLQLKKSSPIFSLRRKRDKQPLTQS